MLIQYAYGQKIYRMEDQMPVKVFTENGRRPSGTTLQAKMNEARCGGEHRGRSQAAMSGRSSLGRGCRSLLALERFGGESCTSGRPRRSRARIDMKLVVAKGGLRKIKPVRSRGRSRRCGIKGKDGQPVKGSAAISFMGGKFVAQQTTLDVLASMLSQSPEVGRPVLDKTGLTGKYNFTLNWSPTLSLPGGLKMPAQSEDAASVFTALEDDLGLKLVSSTGTQETLVVEQVNRPSAD